MPITASSAIARVTSAPISAGPVALNVADLERVARFWRDAIGLHERADDGDVVRLGTPDRDLVVLHRTPDARPAPQAAGLFHVAILYPTRGELADALRRLIRAGIDLDGAADHGVSEALYLRDPDENGVELYWDRPQDRWPRTPEGELAMYTRALDLQDLLKEGGGG